MIAKILGRFGYHKTAVYEEKLKALEQNTEKVILKLRAEVARAKAHPVVDINLADPAPLDSEKRKLFVARVAQFHHEAMRGKVRSIIAVVREQITQVARDTFGYSQHEFDIYLKGTENALWLIHDWGEDCVNEQIANQSGEGAEDAKEQLKDQLNQK